MIEMMTKWHRFSILGCAAVLTAMSANAQQASPFRPGPVFDFARAAAVDADLVIPKDTKFKLLFDGEDAAMPGAINRLIDTAARFINMNVAAGIPAENIRIAIVFHGPAAWDITRDAVYGRKTGGKANGSAAAIAQLIAHGVDIYMCGQSAAAQGIAKADLLPGVRTSLSAMVVDAYLQQQGYTLNPF
jgi:intracellular sulfur oxidation DsrE/DsrF family protein